MYKTDGDCVLLTHVLVCNLIRRLISELYATIKPEKLFMFLRIAIFKIIGLYLFSEEITLRGKFVYTANHKNSSK